MRSSKAWLANTSLVCVEGWGVVGAVVELLYLPCLLARPAIVHAYRLHKSGRLQGTPSSYLSPPPQLRP